MRTDLSAAHDVPRPLLSILARSCAVALLSLMVVTCHSETTAPAVPKSLEFTVQPSNGNAVTALAPIQITAQDGSGHTLTNFSGPITVALGTNPGAATLSGTKTVNATSGVAVFSSLVVNRPGAGFTLTSSTAAAAGVTATSAGFTITPGPVSQLIFSVQPSNATAGVAIGPAIEVTAQDAAGNTVTTFAGNVTMTIGTNPQGGTLTGTATVAASAGVAAFNNLSIDKAGTGYKLTATAGAGSGQSNAFNVVAATATQLVFTTQPSATAAGLAITPAVVVTAQDAFGNPAAAFANAVTVAITGGTGKAGAALSGTKTITAAGGTATFSTLSIDSVGTGYTLSATATGLVGGFASATFNIVPGVATQLVFTGQPSNATAGANIAPAMVVTARDAKGNTAAGFTGSVALTIGTNAGGGTLSGTATVNAVAGIATFAAVNIDKSGIGYTLTAGSGTLTGATSNGFNIVAGAATKVVFTGQPTSTLSAATINSVGGVKVSAQDGLGNTDLTFTGNVAVAIGTNAGSGTLSGTLTIAAASGVATFSNLSIDKVGTGYTLAASASGLTGGVSSTFNIINSVATHLAFAVQPSTAVAGVVIAPPFTVTALDASNNVAADFTAAIAVIIGTNAGAGTLSGTASVVAVAGVATFSTLSIDKTGTGYTLSASAGALAGATSATFNITPGIATHLGFAVQPTNATAGVAIAPSIVVNALDAHDNIATAYVANVVAAIGTNPGSGTLSGSASVAAVAGVATFANLSIDKAGIGYTLHATSGSLTDATSSTFDIAAAGLSQLIFTSQPVASQAGAHIAPAVAVSGEDAFNNLVTTFAGNVTVAIGTNGGSPAPGTLSGTTTVAASGGIATFGDLSIDKAGSGYTLTATASGASAGTSIAFDVTPGAATVLAFTVQPAASTIAGSAISPPVIVAAQDGLGNTVPSFIGNITVAITPATGKAGAVLSGTKTVAATAGVATFSNLSIDSAATGYTLTSTASGLGNGISGSFDIAPSTATKLVFTVQPVATVAGAGITPSVAVSAQDGLGNTDPTFTGNVTVAITGGTGKTGAHLGGTLTQAAVAGVATFAGLAVDSAGSGYTLTATGATLTPGASSAFIINAGTATTLVFAVQPTSAAAGAAIAPTVVVVAKDGQGNIDPTFTASVSLAAAVNPGGATPNNAAVSAVAGVATFGTLFLDKVGIGYKLQASGGALTSAQSSAFNITPGPATHLAFTVQPTTTTAFANIAPAVKVTVQDAFNNTVTSFANNVVVAIGTNPGGGTLGGALTKAAVAGVATYSGLNINATGVGYTLSATATGLTPAASNVFDIVSSVATRLFFTVQPSSATAGASTITVTVEARDASGQVAAGFGGNVTLGITSGTGTPGATLTGTKTVAATTGTAVFSGLSIDKSGIYKLTATDNPDAVTEATSGFFTINHDVATHVAYSIQPSTTGALATITPQVELTALDANNNLVTNFVGNVTLAINNNPGTPSPGTLSGTLTKAVTGGVAVFSDLSINNQGVGYTLDATSSLPTLTSNGFDITPSTANHLVITAQPTTTTAGQAISALTLEARDASNALLTGFSGSVTVQITGGTGTSGATLSGTTTRSAVSGVVSFTDLSIDKKGSGYKLSVTATGLSGATTSSFAINAGTASQVAFLVDPPSSPTSSGVALAPAIQADVEDALGNRVTTYNGTVTVAIFANPSGGTLSGSTSATTGNAQLSNGVATFSDLSIDAAGVGYRLQVTGTGLSGGDISTAFTISAGVADHLVFTVAPSDRTAGLGITPSIRVTAFDALGNVVTSFTQNVTLAITSGTGTSGATLSGTATQAAVSGVATFAGMSIDKAGAGYTLSATSTVTGTTSATFNITPGAATHIAFTVQPSNTASNASITPPVLVTALDAFGNTDTTYSANVTVAMGTNAGGAGSVLSGTKVQASAHGVATFNDLSINNTGVGYTITAQSGAFALAGSNAFNIF